MQHNYRIQRTETRPFLQSTPDTLFLSNQSHLEFAGEAVASFSQHPENDFIQSTIYDTTNRFNAVRFGNETLAPSVIQSVDTSLAKLRQLLETN